MKKEYINVDQTDELIFFSKKHLIDWFLQSEQYLLSKYIRLLRNEEYYSNIKFNKFLKYYYRRKRNILGRKLGFIIHPNNFGEGLKIYHYGSIIVHPDARIGKNCILHGNCCIGSKGGYPDLAPILGDNIDIGQNSQILGNIFIADNVKIGAGAVVTKSVFEAGTTIVGIPGKPIK